MTGLRERERKKSGTNRCIRISANWSVAVDILYLQATTKTNKTYKVRKFDANTRKKNKNSSLNSIFIKI